MRGNSGRGCCGRGKALRQIAQGNNYFTYGVELDESRAEEAQTRLHRVGFGSFFYSRVSHEAFHPLFLNPPYLSVLNENGGRSRHEKKFLIESLCHLMDGDLLIYIIPYYRLTSDICRVLCDSFDDLSVWRFTDGEFKRFKQVAVLGKRKRRDADLPDTLWPERYKEVYEGNESGSRMFRIRAAAKYGIGPSGCMGQDNAVSPAGPGKAVRLLLPGIQRLGGAI